MEKEYNQISNKPCPNCGKGFLISNNCSLCGYVEVKKPLELPPGISIYPVKAPAYPNPVGTYIRLSEKESDSIWIVSPEDTSKIEQLEDYSSQRQELVEGGILGIKEKAITYSKPKHHKTNLEFWKAFCIATGKEFFGYKTTKARVLYIGMEDSVFKLTKRINKMRANFPETNDLHITVLKPEHRNIDTIEKLIDISRPGFVIIDPLTKLLKKEDKKEDVEGLLNRLDNIIDEYDISILLIHHERKGKGETIDNVRGSSALTAWADTICRIERVNYQKDKIRLEWESRHAEEDLEPIILKFDRGICSFSEDTTRNPQIQEMIRTCMENDSITQKRTYLSELKEKITEALTVSERTVEKVIKGMEDIEEMVDEQDRRRRYLVKKSTR